jgi:glucosamine 6-phosphate synthetase-like amidotransferase/phosphosugar isomerase protein
VLANRTSILLALQKLNQTYSEQGAQKFQAQLLEAHDFIIELIAETAKEKGASAAIAQLREILAIGREHEAMIAGQQPE